LKAHIKNLFLLPALIVGLGPLLPGWVTAQTFTVLHSFTATPSPAYTNSDGAIPQAGLVLSFSGKTLYGTARYGGSSARGTVFALNTDGTGFTNLHSFTGGSDGVGPSGSLILAGKTLYGTAQAGGSSGRGTVFALNTDGTGFTNLHSFTGASDGIGPSGGLTLAGKTLYGTAQGGGSSGAGTVFALNTNGAGFTTLYSFTGGSDGRTPFSGLILSNNTLFGTAYYGGSSGNGTVFALSTDGTWFTNLHSFTATSGYPYYTNSDGANPFAGLILSGDTLYGTASAGGSSGNGTVFALNTNGTGFTTLYSFTALAGSPSINSDGAGPSAGLVLSGNTLYGTAQAGGSLSGGTVFSLNINGTGFMTLYSFTKPSGPYPPVNSDGADPFASLYLSGNTLYGTAYGGGSSGNGTVFSLFIPPQLTIIPSGANVILTWPTNAATFTLQSTTNLVSPAIWTNVSPGPVVVDRQNTITNPILGTQKFYRLSQ